MGAGRDGNWRQRGLWRFRVGFSSQEYELDAILAGCIVDFVFADEGDRDSILDNVVAQDPAAPSTLCGDASIVNQADCLCGGTEVQDGLNWGLCISALVV